MAKKTILYNALGGRKWGKKRGSEQGGFWQGKRCGSLGKNHQVLKTPCAERGGPKAV